MGSNRTTGPAVEDFTQYPIDSTSYRLRDPRPTCLRRAQLMEYNTAEERRKGLSANAHWTGAQADEPPE